MRWSGREVGPSSRIPNQLHQRHWSPRVGDRLIAWRTVPVGGAFDGNVYPACGVIWFLHWLIPILCGYRWVLDEHTGHVRKMTIRELHRPATRWGEAGIRRWRDRHGQAPMDLETGLRWCVENNRLCAIETKGPAWAKNQIWFAMLHATCVKVGHPAWVKRIATLRFPRQTVLNAHRAHVQIAAIYGRGVRGRARRLAHTRRSERSWRGVHFDATW
jgi:hypothetical protein